MPFDGAWEDAAARFGTVQDHDVVKIIKTEDGMRVVLGSFMEEELVVKLPRDKDLKDIVKKARRNDCEVMVTLFNSRDLKVILDAEAFC